MGASISVRKHRKLPFLLDWTRVCGLNLFTTPNSVWVSDMTDIPTDEGWLCLAGHKDLFNGEIVGYAMGERSTKNLVSQSLCRAVTSTRPVKGLMHYADRGSQ